MVSPSKSNNTDSSWKIISEDEIFHRHDFACGVYKDRYIVIAGGRGLQSAVIYNVFNQSHIPLPDLPVSHGLGCCGLVLNSYFYVGDGCRMYRLRLFLSSKRQMEWELVFDEKKLSMDAMVTDGHEIFFMEDFNWTFRYHPSTHKLFPIRIQKLDSHLLRFTFATVVVRNKIYILGESMNMDVFDIATQSWSQAPPLPEPVSHMAATTVDKWIVVTGGLIYEYKTSLIFLFDTVTQQWTINDVTPLERYHHHRCVKVGSQIISVGGSDGYQRFSPMEATSISCLIPDWKWERIKPYFMLRKLVAENRAAPITMTEHFQHDYIGLKLDVNMVIQKLFAPDLSLDVFWCIISFAI